MKRLRFIAAVDDGTLTQMAIISCDEVAFPGEGMPSENFLDQLTKATTQWLTLNETGQKAWEDSVRDFNFGDLEMYADNPELQNILVKHEIFNLEVEVITTGISNFSFDTVLWDEDLAEELTKEK